MQHLVSTIPTTITTTTTTTTKINKDNSKNKKMTRKRKSDIHNLESGLPVKKVADEFYIYLKDAKKTWKEKRDFALKMWTNDSTSTENANQILHCFATALFNNSKKRDLSLEDTELIWTTLASFISSGRLGLEMKPSIIRSIVFELEQCVKAKRAPGGVLECVCSVLASSEPGVRGLLLENVETLLEINDKLFCVLDSRTTDALVPTVLRLLEVILPAITALIEKQNRKQNVRHLYTIVTKLLGPFTGFAEISEENEKVETGFRDLLRLTLFRKSEAELYHQFLYETSTVPYVSLLFKMIAQLVSTSQPSLVGVSRLLNLLLELYSSNHHGRKSREPMVFARKLWTTICDTSCSQELKDTVTAALLEGIEKQELFLPVEDISGTDYQWLEERLDSVLLATHFSLPYVRILSSLIGIEPGLIRKKLARVIQFAFAHQLLEAEPNVVIELCVTYAKLRMVPELAETFLTVLGEHKPEYSVPKSIFSSFDDSFESLVHTQVDSLAQLFFSKATTYFERNAFDAGNVCLRMLLGLMSSVNAVKCDNVIVNLSKQLEVIVENHFNPQNSMVEVDPISSRVTRGLLRDLATSMISLTNQYCEDNNDSGTNSKKLLNMIRPDSKYDATFDKHCVQWLSTSLSLELCSESRAEKYCDLLLKEIDIEPSNCHQLWNSVLQSFHTLVPMWKNPAMVSTFCDLLTARLCHENETSRLIGNFFLAESTWEIPQMRISLLRSVSKSLGEITTKTFEKGNEISMWITKFVEFLDDGENNWKHWRKIVLKFLKHNELKTDRGNVHLAAEKGENLKRLNSLVSFIEKSPISELSIEIRGSITGSFLVLAVTLGSNADTSELWRRCVSLLQKLKLDVILRHRLDSASREAILPGLCLLLQDGWNLSFMDSVTQLLKISVSAVEKCADVGDFFERVLMGPMFFESENLFPHANDNSGRLISCLSFSDMVVSRLGSDAVEDSPLDGSQVGRTIAMVDQFVGKLSESALGLESNMQLKGHLLNTMVTLFKTSQKLKIGQPNSTDYISKFAKMLLKMECVGDSDKDTVGLISSSLLWIYKQRTDLKLKDKYFRKIPDLLVQIVARLDIRQPKEYKLFSELVSRWLFHVSSSVFSAVLSEADKCLSLTAQLILRNLAVRLTSNSEFDEEKRQILNSDLELVLGRIVSCWNIRNSRGDLDADLQVAAMELFSNILRVDKKLSGLSGRHGMGLFLTLMSSLPFHFPFPSDVFLRLFSFSHQVLNHCLLYHTPLTMDMAPSFLAVFKRMVSALLSRPRPSDPSSEECERDLLRCYQLTTRLNIMLEGHKRELGKVLPYLVADMVAWMQESKHLSADGKAALLPGIYALLNSCDKHGIALLSATLQGGHKELFKLAYETYTKYYQYTGTV